MTLFKHSIDKTGTNSIHYENALIYIFDEKVGQVKMGKTHNSRKEALMVDVILFLFFFLY